MIKTPDALAAAASNRYPCALSRHASNPMPILDHADIRLRTANRSPHYQLSHFDHPHVRGFEETLRFPQGFSLIRHQQRHSRPVAYPAFDSLGYIGLCFCFSSAPPRELAFSHLYQGHLNASSGYRYAGGIDRDTRNTKYYISLRFTRAYLETLTATGHLPAWLQRLLDDNGRCEQIPVPAAIRNQARHICHQPPAHTPAARLRLEAAVLQWLVHILEHSTPGNSAAAVDRLLAILHREYRETLTIPELARRCGLNQTYLKQQFKTRTGQSIASYINNLRMDTALRLLRDRPDLNIKTIAAMSGQQAKYFSSWFMRRHGISASDWRDMQQRRDQNRE